MSVTLVTSVTLFIIVWLLKPGPEYVSLNWNAAPGVVCVKLGFEPTPVHVEFTPLILTLFVVAVGDKLPDAVIPLPVVEY